MKSISVIVPVYNVQKYLEGCVQSILMQTFKDFELILVDDGATDESGKICDILAKKDDRIFVIHQPNGGLSAARNTGIQKASGKYMLFADSDDYIEKNTLKDAFELAEKYKAEVVIYGYFADVYRKNGTVNSYRNHGEDMVLTEPIAIAAQVMALKRNFVFDSSCNKLYLTEIIKANKIIMPEGEIFEDTAFNINLFPYITKLVISSECYYHYTQREILRITNTYNPNKLLILRERHFLLLSYLRKYFSDESLYIKQAYYFYVKYVISSIMDYFKTGIKITKTKKMIEEFLNDEELQIALTKAEGFSKIDCVTITFLKTNNKLLILLFNYFLFILKNKLKPIYFSIKSQRERQGKHDRKYISKDK